MPKLAARLSPHCAVLTSAVSPDESQTFPAAWHVAVQLAPVLPSVHTTSLPPEQITFEGGGGLGEGGGGEGGGGVGGGGGAGGGGEGGAGVAAAQAASAQTA